MGQLVDGAWQDLGFNIKLSNGKYLRKGADFRNWITVDGSPGSSGKGGFEAEAGRYHLYVSLACPWAHRTLIFRKLKGLEKIISYSVVNPYMGEQGWSFTAENGRTSDTLYQAKYLHEIYSRAQSDYTGRVSVPVLWDKYTHTLVSNESSEIIRMFNSAFDEVGAMSGDYYPQELRKEIDVLNEIIYSGINNGVYKAGFATSQAAYDEAVNALFLTLDQLDHRLENQRYLLGNQITEADWRLFTTLIRFDPVYVGHFKCNRNRLIDSPNLWGYVRDLYQTDGIADTVNLDHIKQHYYQSQTTVNPSRIVAMGPPIDYGAPHDREQLSLTRLDKEVTDEA